MINPKSRNPLVRAVFLIISFSLLVSIIGCDAFVRKFTRKRKKDTMPQEEMVLSPEEYKPAMNKEQLYREYLMYWKTWHGEFVESLLQNKSNKKQVDCAEQAIKNLVYIRGLLMPEKQKKLDVYINQLSELKSAVGNDVYGSDTASNRQKAERLGRNIFRDFSYNKVKGFIL